MNEGPAKEKRAAQATLRTAISLGDSGRAPEGLARLRDGRSRMELLAGLGLTWAQELAHFYGEAETRYCRVYRSVKARIRATS
jgi:hypothetical protein